jgi:UDP-N-acetylmuramoyl-tripeptide--D-alanyl-D-alanine ligase
MGNINTTIATIFELVDNMKEDGIVMLNEDDPQVAQNYQKYVKRQQIILYGYNTKVKNLEFTNIKFQEDASGISFDIVQRGLDIGTFKVGVMGEYIVADILGALQLAEKLNLSVTEISRGISEMKPVEHRLQPILNKHTNVLVIDDSYNGNPQGVMEAIKVLSHFDQNRRIYITPGLVESGERAKEIHYNIGKQLAPVAGIVILLRNSVTPYIAQGLTENGFEKDRIIWFDSATQAHKALPKIVRPYDVVMFQNDWPDNYV